MKTLLQSTESQLLGLSTRVYNIPYMLDLWVLLAVEGSLQITQLHGSWELLNINLIEI